MDTVVDFTLAPGGAKTSVSTNKLNVGYTIEPHPRTPSLWQIKSSSGPHPDELQGCFTSRPQAENHLRNYLQNKTFSPIAYADAKGKPKNPTPIKFKPVRKNASKPKERSTV